MDRAAFTGNCSGRIVLTDHGNPAFVPNQLPPLHPWEHDLVSATIRTAEAVAVLSRAAQDIDSPLLVNSISNIFANKEAQVSSRIEGIHTTTVELLLAQEDEEDEEEHGSSGRLAESSQEVLNYLRALRVGLARVKDPHDIPICNRLIKDLHTELLRGVRGSEKNPGHFRVFQNAIGREGDTEAEALYVPPPPREMEQAMQQLEDFIHSDYAKSINTYTKAAYVHYQFEAIHPFMDGNGRIGRLLLILMLCDAGMLQEPLIYPSAYYEANKEKYYDYLFRVTTQGDWCSWLLFFLSGIEAQAKDALKRIGVLKSLHQHYMQKFQDSNSPSKLLKLIDRLFHNPIVTAKQVARHLDVGSSTAHRYLDVLVEQELLKQIVPERKRNRVFLAWEVMQSIEND
jgi:Fic family protein